MKPDFAGRRVRFIADFDYSPTPRITIAYKKGMVEFVRLECAQQAVAAGKATVGAVPDMPEALRRQVER